MAKNGGSKKDELVVSGGDKLGGLGFRPGAVDSIEIDGYQFEEAIDEKSFPFWTPQNDLTDHPAMISGTIMKRYTLPEKDGYKAREAVSLRGIADWCVPVNESLKSQLGSLDNPDPRAVIGKAIAVEYVGTVKVKNFPNPMNRFKVYFLKEKSEAAEIAEPVSAAQAS